MNKINNKIIFISIFALVIVAVAVLALVMYNPKNAAPVAGMENLSLCLKEKNVTMYGAYWCPHCQDVKKSFGDFFKNVPYVECTEEVQKCTDAKIQGYPTWVFPDGKKLEGGDLNKLSEASGCPIN